MGVDLWKDLAERIYREFLLECTECGEVCISEEKAISIIQKVIEQFARERITRINFKVKKNGDTFKTG